MRINRLVAGTVTAGLLGLTPIALAAPSQATDVLTTTTTAAPSATELEYGGDFYVTVDVAGSDGLSAYKGTSTLVAMEAGSTTWVPVATNTSAGSDFFDVKPQVNTAYKVVYSGYTAATTYEDTYVASESAAFSVTVSRKLTIKNPRGTFIKGKVSPKYAKKKIFIEKKVGKKWKKFKKIKTDKKSKFQITLPAYKKRTYFRFVVKGDAQYAATAAEGSTIKYRTAARMTVR
jgi:hypothetical protein